MNAERLTTKSRDVITGAVADDIEGFRVTCVDNGMPTVLIRAADLGLSGDEDPAALEADEDLARTLERIRFAAAESMGLVCATVARVSSTSPDTRWVGEEARTIPLSFSNRTSSS